MKRILIVKFWAIGDILMATPLLRALKRQWPDCSIAWLVDERYAGILAGNPLLDEVIPFDTTTWRRHFRYGQWLAYWRMTRNLQRELSARKFDIVLNLTAEKWWVLPLNTAPVKIGLFPRPVPGGIGRWYTVAVPRSAEDHGHNSEHYLRAAAALEIDGPFDNRLSLGVSPQSAAAVEDFLADQPHRPLIVLHPGTSQASKCWLPGNFAAVAAVLTDEFTVVITGSPGEKPLAEQIYSLVPEDSRRNMLIAAGVLLGLSDTSALVDRASAVVTGDTSLLHIASALDTPLVGIYGSTRPGENAPLFGPQVLLFDNTVPCAPCYQAHCPLQGKEYLRCQRAVTPAQVLAALDSLRKETYEPRLSV